jgi:hypothetical protein
MHATAPQDRIPTSQKVGYGFGSFLDMWGHWLYQSLAFHVFNIGLKVSPGLISTALGVKILVDAVSDAMFGWVSDNTRSRWGRRRPFILIGGVLSGIGLPLMFAVGRGWTEMEYFWFMLVSLVLYVPVMSCFNMPWVSLGSEMTPDYHERTRLMATKMAIQKIPELAMFGAAQFTTLAIFHDAAGKPDVLLNVGAVYVCVPCTVRTRHGWANQARERDLDLQRAQDEIAALRNGLITALGMRWITVRLPTGWSESRAPDDAAIIAWARQLAVQAQSMETLAGRSQTLPEIVLEGRVTSVSLQGSKRLYVRPTRTDALLVFQAASRMRRQGWECIQVRVTLRTQSGEVHLNGAAGWAAQDLISVAFGGEAADAFYAHASSIGVTIGEWAKVTWPPVDLGASAPAAPVGGGR